MTPEQRIERKRTADESRTRIEAAHRHSQTVVDANYCPQCGSKIRRNNSLAGWYQCEQYGSDKFRARPQDKPCSWQGFTE